MNLLLMILQGVELVSSEIVPVEQLVERLKTIFTLNPNAQVSIQNLAADAIQADDATLQLIADWQKAHPSAPAAPAGPAADKSSV
jgi:hypothetical protein